MIEPEPARHQECLQYFQEKYQEQLNITISKSHFIEFCNREVSKGAALKKLARDLGIKQKEVMAIGG